LRHGFHEDGLASAVHVARLMGAEAPWGAATFPEPAVARSPVGSRPVLGRPLTGTKAA